jgi:predicted nucleotidyltransferase
MQKKSFNIIVSNIKKMKKAILPNDKLILFGSQARHDASANSDWDMLILLDKEEISKDDFATYAYPFVELGWKFGEYFSMKIYTVSEWMKRKSSPFFKNVEKEGIEL